LHDIISQAAIPRIALPGIITLTKQLQGIGLARQGSVEAKNDENLSVSRLAMVDAIVQEPLDYFSDGRGAVMMFGGQKCKDAFGFTRDGGWMAMAKPAHKSTEIELEPDAWERFERATDVVAKSPPQHRTKGKPIAKRKASPKPRAAPKRG
jgi:hypothetical protein